MRLTLYKSFNQVVNDALFYGLPKKPLSCISVNKISKDDNGYPIHLVCIREDGTFITPRTMQHTSRIIKKEIFKDFDFHSLRHTHASMLAEIGVEQKYYKHD